MKEDKESFVLYNSFYEPIKILKDEQLGRLFRAIFNYTINAKITTDDDILVPFMFIKGQIDINANKWLETKQKRIEAGRLGGIQRAINENQTLSSKSKQCLDELSNAKQNQANQGVNVNVNVNDNVNVYDNVINNKKNNKEKYKKESLPDWFDKDFVKNESKLEEMEEVLGDFK